MADRPTVGLDPSPGHFVGPSHCPSQKPGRSSYTQATAHTFSTPKKEQPAFRVKQGAESLLHKHKQQVCVTLAGVFQLVGDYAFLTTIACVFFSQATPLIAASLLLDEKLETKSVEPAGKS